MEFVNTIAKIVHMEVHLRDEREQGIGDAFLLVWKFPADVTLEDVGGRGATRCAAPPQVANMNWRPSCRGARGPRA